jgi:hypothetical protein
VRRDQVGDFGRVDARAAPDRDEAVHARVLREVGGVLEGVERRLHASAVVEHDLDALALDRLAHAVGVAERGDARVGDQHRARDAEAFELPAGVRHGARPELDRRGLQREDGLVLSHATSVPDRASR